MSTVAYPHPGEILFEEFLRPMGISQYRLAKEVGLQQSRIGAIVSGQRAMSPDTALRLSKFFGTSDDFWITLQAHYDAATTKEAIAEVLEEIKPWQTEAA
jgi:addiction module HigA family antidote